MPRGVGRRCGELRSSGSRERRGTLATELVSRRIAGATRGANRRQWSSALATEPHSGWILGLAPWTPHPKPPTRADEWFHMVAERRVCALPRWRLPSPAWRPVELLRGGESRRPSSAGCSGWEAWDDLRARV